MTESSVQLRSAGGDFQLMALDLRRVSGTLSGPVHAGLTFRLGFRCNCRPQPISSPGPWTTLPGQERAIGLTWRAR